MTPATKAIAADAGTALMITTGGIATVAAAPPATMSDDGVTLSGRNVYFLDSSTAVNTTAKSVVLSSVTVWKLAAGNSLNLNTWSAEADYNDKYYLDVDGYSGTVVGRDIVTGAAESPYGGTRSYVGFRRGDARQTLPNCSPIAVRNGKVVLA